MKNNILIILLIFYQILFFNKLFAKEIKFDASDIEINEGGNLTIANNGIAKIEDDGIIVEGVKIKYFKDQSLIVVEQGEISKIDLEEGPINFTLCELNIFANLSFSLKKP